MIMVIIIPKTNIFTEARTQDIFRVCVQSSCNLVVEENFVLCTILLSCLVSELQKTSSPGLEPKMVVAVVPVISLSKQTALVLAAFSYRA
jgi:hypothetical protein